MSANHHVHKTPEPERHASHRKRSDFTLTVLCRLTAGSLRRGLWAGLIIEARSESTLSPNNFETTNAKQEGMNEGLTGLFVFSKVYVDTHQQLVNDSFPSGQFPRPRRVTLFFFFSNRNGIQARRLRLVRLGCASFGFVAVRRACCWASLRLVAIGFSWASSRFVALRSAWLRLLSGTSP